MSEQILRIGNYILLEKLAVGGMAEVYLAKMTSSDKLVAIKKVLPVHAETPEYLKLFQEEVKVSLNLQHGNIVGFIDFIHENEQMYLVMDFVNGFTLRRVVGDLKFKKTKFDLPQCLFVVSEVASGLDYAHRSVDAITNKKLNIIHRDINPQNIMVTFDGCVKIIDFGIAKSDTRTDVTKVGTIKGKFSYMSPEQASALPLDSRADIYALGVVLWELITGKRMHAAKNDLETLKKIKNNPVQLPREINPLIPVELELIVMKALEKDVEKRFQKISDFKFELDQYLQSHFADFRPADFSQFISVMYAEVIKSRVEKLLYFSKVKFEQASILSATPPASAAKNENPGRSDGSRKPELPEGFESKKPIRQREIVSFDELNKENPFASEVKVQTKQKAAAFFTAKPAEEENRAPESFSFVQKLESSFIGNFKHLAVMLLVGYACFSFYKQNMVIEVASLPASANTEQSLALPNGARAPAKAEDFSKVVYQKLKASDKLAFAHISIENDSASDTKIFVDGKLLYDRTPIPKCPVYANQITTVTAFNSRTNMYDERKIVVQAGKTMNVKLTLRPYRAR